MKYYYDTAGYVIGTKKDEKIIRATTQDNYNLIRKLDTPMSLDEYRDKYGLEDEEVLWKTLYQF